MRVSGRLSPPTGIGMTERKIMGQVDEERRARQTPPSSASWSNLHIPLCVPSLDSRASTQSTEFPTLKPIRSDFNDFCLLGKWPSLDPW